MRVASARELPGKSCPLWNLLATIDGFPWSGRIFDEATSRAADRVRVRRRLPDRTRKASRTEDAETSPVSQVLVPVEASACRQPSWCHV
jgi:hypothetical protein